MVIIVTTRAQYADLCGGVLGDESSPAGKPETSCGHKGAQWIVSTHSRSG